MDLAAARLSCPRHLAARISPIVQKPLQGSMSGAMSRAGRAQYSNMAPFHVVAGRSFHVLLVPIEDPDHPTARFTAFVSTVHCLDRVPTYSNLHASIESWCDFASSLQPWLVRKHPETMRFSCKRDEPSSCPPNPISMVALRSKNESRLIPSGKDLQPGCAGVQCIWTSFSRLEGGARHGMALLRNPPPVWNAKVCSLEGSTSAMTGPQRSSNCSAHAV